jgi:short-subunit dehydrogenase involved in D-alanine esterification of teichoic acids
MRTLEGKTALVTGGGQEIGRAIALALSARGVRVVVTGREEKALGETVGEIAHGGGKARHLAGDVRDPAHLAAAVARAIDVFGGLDLVIETDPMGASYTFKAAAPRLTGGGRLIVIGDATELAGIPCEAVAVRDEEPEQLAQRIVSLCAS